MSSHPDRAPIRRHRALAVALTASAAIGAASTTGAARAADPPTPTTRAATTATNNVVVEWNRSLLSLVQTPGAQPPTIQPTRDFAIMSAAMYDAVASPDRSHPHDQDRRNGGHPSREAAAAQAAHDVLSTMFPSSVSTLDQQLAADLTTIPAGHTRSAGIDAGHRAAAGELRARAADGATVSPPPYQTTGAAGDYRPTPPGFATPVFTHWGQVTPFVLRRPDQFRPAPPPALGSPVYAAALNEVESIGRDTSTTRTSEQTTIAMFWSAPIQNYWNAIAEQVALARHSDTQTSARLFALLDLGVADATIALYDAKYTYRLWRPITAIRLADTDGNQLTAADPAWTPLAITPADPSYPGAHSTISAAAAAVLSAVFGDHVGFTVASPILPGVSRSFASFRDAVTEAGLSRIYAGVHTRADHRAGVVLGQRIGQYTLRHALSDHHA